MNATIKKTMWVWTALLAVLLTGPARAAVPTVNGLFYGDGDVNNYFLLATNAQGRGAAYYRLDGSSLYIAVLVSPAVNDNVFGSCKSSADPDYAYVRSADWTRPNGHTFKMLENSDHLEFQFTAGSSSWTWSQDYVYQSGGVWLSDSGGPDGGGTTPPGLVSASSLQWNMSSSPWDITLGGTRTSTDTYKSPDDLIPDNTVTNNGWPKWDPANQWEWAMVYEMKIDVSAYAGKALSFNIKSAHNSPPKVGDPDVPIDITDAYDHGDAPDTYRTTLASGGPEHKITLGGPILGNGVDAESNGIPTVNANGDDLSGAGDDEDGVTFLSPLIPGQSMSIQVVGTPGAKLDAWIDWNNDGTFDAGDQIATSVVIGASGTNTLSVYVPITAVTTAPLYARFRVSTAGGLGPTGLVADGEVEDYIIAASLGDRVWLDTDKDGIQDAGEIGLGNVTVDLYRIVGGSTNLENTAITDVNGGYFFENLAPGFYLVKFYLPDPTYQFSPRDQGVNDAVDSDANTLTGTSLTVVLAAGDNNRTVDAGMWVKTTLATVIGFDAVLRDDGQVAVQWQTSSEKGTLGYYVERLDEASGAYGRVNARLVPAKIMVQGVRSYSVIDAAAAAGGTYTYRLIEIENTGTLNAYGPYVVTVAGGAADSATSDSGDAVLNVPVAPAVEVAVPVISALTAGTGHMVIRWSSAAGQTYRLERSADLVDFEPIASGIPATAPENVTVVVDGAQAGFYRVTVE